MTLAIDPHALMLTCGLLGLCLPFTVWLLLRRRHDRRRIVLWNLAGLMHAMSFVLFGLRGRVPDGVSIHVANTAWYLGFALMVGVMRSEVGRPPRWLLIGTLTVLATAATLAADRLDGDGQWRQAMVNLTLTVYAVALSLTAAELGRQIHSRAARLIAQLYALAALPLLARALMFFLRLGPETPFAPDLSFVISFVALVAAYIGTNVGYIGLALDRAAAAARDQSLALETLRERQIAADLAARTRAAVAGERARTTRLLAHEVRQPLHNAAVALQSAVGTLSRSRDAAEAARAIEQAQAVIRRVSATLDNTVAATALLSGEGRISTADTDLQMLIELCLGDLPPETRPRVQVDYRADARSARLEPTLVRLALRNLLTNATLYSPPSSPVVLRVLDSDEPLALVIEVADQGPGIPDDLRERIFDEGVRGQQPTVPGYGLGLHVVRRVARLHGGSIVWAANQPQGSVFRLTLPQGDPG